MERTMSAQFSQFKQISNKAKQRVTSPIQRPTLSKQKLEKNATDND